MAANLGSVAPPVPATANLVGNTFVNKYYNVLHQSPQVVYRFYTDRSILSRAEAGASGAIDIVIGHVGINQKIMSLDYRDFRAEIRTVDSLESLNGSVLVMVTGSLSSNGRPKRNFVQTFFLAPQEVGFYVLNDMFRYLDGDLEPLAPLANGIVEQHIPALEPVNLQPPPMQETREMTAPPPEEVPSLHQQGQLQEEPEPSDASVAPESVEVAECLEDSSPPQVPDESAPAEEQVPVTDEGNAEDAPKKSYASILSASTSTPTSGLKYMPAKTDRHLAPSQATQLANAPAASNQVPAVATSNLEAGNDENTSTELEGDGCSVYVKNLPLSITATELEEEFKKFGSIKIGGVNLRNQRVGVCFAFVEYDEPSSAQKAIEASPISIGGRQVYVEEKKPMPLAQRALRGRFSQGRGYEGMRGRGYFSGRGFARGGSQDFERDGGRGGRGNYGGGNAYSSTFNTVNGYRRTDGQGWNGPRPVRRGAGTPAGRGRALVQG